MDREAEVIHEQMEETRESLARKLETLESQVAGAVENVTGTVEAVSNTVEQVKEAVTGTVETVKDSVTGTVETVKETVKETFDIAGHVRRHPWLGFGGAVALGFASGLLTRRLLPAPYGSRRQRARGVPTLSTLAEQPVRFNGRRAAEPKAAEAAPTYEATAAPREPAGPSWLDSLTSTFGPEIQKLKGLAVGTALGIVREMIARSAPGELGTRLTELVDDVTTKLGGQVIQGPILERASSGCPGQEHMALS
jgi:ElaB/YqjD/DUF883 family membrane-anchored ribosome-binding protein